MKIKQFLYFITLFFCILIGSRAFAESLSEEEAKLWAQNKGNEILNILTSTDIESKFAKLDDILHNDIDIDYAARYVVGKYWNRMSESQRKDYLDLFQKYTESLYKSYPLTIDKGEVSFTVDNIIADTKLVNVHCTVYVKKLGHDTQNASNGGFKIIFIIVKDDAGKIKVRDIKVSESSFLISYRDRFYKMIHDDNDDDIDWFLDDLYMRIEDNNERNAKNLDEQEF